MAKKAKITADKTALDAVEDALSIDFEEIENPGEADLAKLEQSLAETAGKLRTGKSSKKEAAKEPQDSTVDAALDPIPESPPAPANDEHSEELNNLLYAIQQKPKNRVFLWTVLTSILWLGLCGYYGITQILPTLEQQVTFQSLAGDMKVLTFLAVTIVPLMPLWGLAFMMRRALEMRHAAGNMTQVSLRLLQPEKVAADSVATVGTAIRREMTAIGDGVERAIARAGELEFMVQKEVMSLERSYGDSEVRLRRLIDEIGNEREEVINHAEKLRTSISESQTGLTNEIEIASNRIEETIKNASDSLTQSLDNEGLSITSRMKDTSEGLIDILSRTGEEITTNLGSGSDKLKSDVEGQIREMSEVISTSGQAIATLIDGRTASFDSAANQLTDKLDTGKKAFDIAFTERANDLSKIMATAGQSVSSLLKSSASELAEHNNKLLLDFEESKKHLESTFNHQSDQFEKLAVLASDNMVSAIDTGSNRFEQSAERVARQVEDNLSMRASDFDSGISETASTIEAKIAENIDKVRTTVADESEKLGEIVSERIDQIQSTLSTSGNNLVSALGMRTEALDKVLKERTDTIGLTIAERLSGFGQNLTGHVDEAVTHLKSQTDQLEEKTKTVEEVISKSTKSVEETIRTSAIEFASGLKESLKTTAEKSAELNAALNTASNEFSSTIESSKNTLSDIVSEGNQNLSVKLEETQESIKSNLNSGAEAIEQSMRSGADAVEENLKSGAKTIGQFMSTGVNAIEKHLTDGNDALKDKLVQGTGTLSTTISETAEALGKQLSTSTQELDSALSVRQESLSSSIEANTKSLQEALDERANNLASKLSQGVHRVSTALETKGTAAVEEFDRNVANLEDRLQQSSHNVERQFAAGTSILNEHLQKGEASLLEAVSKSVSEAGSAIDGKAEKLSELLSERAELINGTLGKSLVETQRELEKKTGELDSLLTNRTDEITSTLDQRMNELNASLSARSSELTKIIEQDAKPIVSTIEATGSSINNQLANMSRAVADEANTLFANLASSNEHLETLIESATKNLSLMQTTLGQQSSGFAQAVESSKSELEESSRLANEVEMKLQSATGNLMQNMASIANRLEAQGSVLQDATRLIDAAQTNLENTLDDKQIALQELASGLVLRSDEINSSVSSFAQTISGMVEDIHTKSMGTGGTIAAEISSAIDDATARFGDSVDAMRSAAATIRKELEETREQMRRGVLELPDETAENAAAMRRVVTDQIAALKDLSSIVERSGKVLDTSSSEIRPRQAAGGTQQFTTQQAAPAPVTNFPPDTVARDRTPPPAPRPRSEAPADFAPTRPAPVRPERQTQQNQPESGGWVSDLLRRASRDEPEPQAPPAPLPDTRSPDHMVESLNSLSMDIASAIDHEASVELWERYQRGETNVFTRRLYTLQGQQTFDEIRRKYAQNGEFRNAVDRYIDDFERLLQDVSKSNNGSNMAQGYLTSDTGKVYTMLAHAAGRFGSQ
ncbi:MAG: hypothetical protein AAF478_12115 [Pseudomonadota bacterium]